MPIKTDSIDEYTSGAGVTIDGVLAKDGHLVTSAIRPAGDSTAAVQLQNAAGTSLVNLDTTNSRVGVRTLTPSAQIHNYVGASGKGLPQGGVDFVQESAGTTYFSFHTPNNYQAGILFCDPDATFSGKIEYDHVWNRLTLSTAGVAALNIFSNQYVGIGTASPEYLLDLYSASNVSQVRLHNLGDTGDEVIAFQMGTRYAELRYYGSNAQLRLWNNNLADMVFGTNNQEAMRIAYTGLVGVGTTDPQAKLGVVRTSATTNAVASVLALGANVTGAGVGAAGLGAGILFQAESTTTIDTTQAAIEASWIVPTHASRTSRLVFKSYDTAAREGIRIDSDGSAALLGFYGHTAVAQQLLATGAGATVDNIITALQALGLVKQA